MDIDEDVEPAGEDDIRLPPLYARCEFDRAGDGEEGILLP